jgi:hypothetical protein
MCTCKDPETVLLLQECFSHWNGVFQRYWSGGWKHQFFFQCLYLSRFALKWKFAFRNTSLIKNCSLQKFNILFVKMGESDIVCDAVWCWGRKWQAIWIVSAGTHLITSVLCRKMLRHLPHIGLAFKLWVTGVMTDKLVFTYIYIKGYAMAHLVEALCYKPEGCGFD